MVQYRLWVAPVKYNCVFLFSIITSVFLSSQNFPFLYHSRNCKFRIFPNLGSEKPTNFSRMRSEGFPFIVGVWGWTCVRVAFVVSSSRRRRQTHALRHHPVLQNMKSGGSLTRNALFGGPKSQNGRSFSCFA